MYKKSVGMVVQGCLICKINRNLLLNERTCLEVPVSAYADLEMYNHSVSNGTVHTGMKGICVKTMIFTSAIFNCFMLVCLAMDFS